MKAITTSVAILTGVSKAAEGGKTLASATVATRSRVKASGAKRNRAGRMMGAICRASRSFGMAFAVVSVIIARDDRDLRSRSARNLSRRRRDRLLLRGCAAPRLAPVDGEPAGAPP